MVGMVYKGSKYWIFEKNKGIPVSNCQHLQGYFLESVLTFLNLKGILSWEIDILKEKGVFLLIYSY